MNRPAAFTRAALLTLVLGALPFQAPAQSDDFAATRAKIEAAMAADVRTPEEVARDPNRKPVETLEFFGLRDDMKIVELMPGGGWYTKILAPVMEENGEFHIAYGTGRVEESLVGQPGFEHVRVAGKGANIYRPEGARYSTIESGDMGVTGADIVLTFRNYHSFDAAGRAEMNRAAHAALKAGGIYAVVDHTRRHGEPDSPENGRRVDPVLAIREIQAAGFELADYSTLHYIADDELRYEVGRKTVTGNTDRFTLKFVKK